MSKAGASGGAAALSPEETGILRGLLESGSHFSRTRRTALYVSPAGSEAGCLAILSACAGFAAAHHLCCGAADGEDHLLGRMRAAFSKGEWVLIEAGGELPQAVFAAAKNFLRGHAISEQDRPFPPGARLLVCLGAKNPALGDP